MRSTGFIMTVCALCLGATVAHAQSFTVGGAVFDDPGNPLFSGVDGVEITVSGPSGTFTVSTSMLGGVWSGFWRIDDVPPGTYTVTPVLDGFEFQRWLFGQVLPDAVATIEVSEATRADIGSVSFLVQDAGTSCNDGNPCTVGDALQDDGSCLGTAAADATVCDDGNPCTASDMCVASVCSGTAVPGCGGSGGGGGGGGPTVQDRDADGTPDSTDNCPDSPNGTIRGTCLSGAEGTCTSDAGCPGTESGRCSVAQADLDADGAGDACDPDRDGDGVLNESDGCPMDPAKDEPGACGCGVVEAPDCVDDCPNDPSKTTPGLCGCGVSDADSDEDGTPDCIDGCPLDSSKLDPGICGCGVADDDRDADGTFDCTDQCPDDPDKTVPGACGCGVDDVDVDTDADGLIDCIDPCPEDASADCAGGAGMPVDQPDVPQGDEPFDDGACGIGCGQTGAPPLAGILLFLLTMRIRMRVRSRPDIRG